MRKLKLLGVALIIASLLVASIPASEVAAATAASDFVISADYTLTKYKGTATDVVIPSSVLKIATDAFKNNTDIVSVTIPDSVKKIEPYAFWGCSNLEVISFGSGINELGDFILANCKGLRSVVVPSNVLSIGIYSFQDDVSLTDITIPYTTRSIHRTAFDGCINLVIHAPAGSYADKYAAEFETRRQEMPDYGWTPEDVDPETPVVIDGTGETGDGETGSEGSSSEEETPGNDLSSVRIVDNRAVFFIDTDKMKTYGGSEQPEMQDDKSSDAGGAFVSRIPKYRIVDGTTVADNAYYKAEGLSALSVPDGIKSIGQFAYARSSVTSVTIPDGCTEIGYGAFYHCDDLDYAKLPDSILSVEPKAFDHTRWVDNFYAGTIGNGDFLISGGVVIAYRGEAEDLIIPDGVRVIASGVFKDNTNIKSVTFPDTLICVGEEAFYGCSNLSGMNLDENIGWINDRAFRGCPISSVSFPENFAFLGLCAFNDDTELLYAGDEPTATRSTSSERLADQSLRDMAPKADESTLSVLASAESGVIVLPIDEGIQASLEGAKRPYILLADRLVYSEELEDAIRRISDHIESLHLKENLSMFDLNMIDDSGIHISKLGKQALTVMIPIPEGMNDSKPVTLTVDRNGQLEELETDIVKVGDDMFVRFKTYHLTPFAIYSTGDTLGDDEIVISETVTQAMGGRRPVSAGDTAKPGFGDLFKAWIEAMGVMKLVIAGLLFISGSVMVAVKKKR